MRSVIISLICAVSTLLSAQNEEVREKHFNVTKNVGLKEYDAVSDFYGKPVKGSLAFQLTN